MTPITWTTTFDDFAALQRWVRWLILRKSLPWLAPHAVIVTLAAVVAAVVGLPTLSVGLLAGGAGWWLALQYAYQKNLAFDANNVMVDASGIHTHVRADPSCASRFGWAGSGELVGVRGGAVVDAGFGAWMFVPARAATLDQLHACRAAATPLDTEVPDGFAEWRLAYSVDRALGRPVVQPPAPKPPMPVVQRISYQLLGAVGAIFLVVEGYLGNLGGLTMGPISWALVGLFVPALAMVAWVAWAQRWPASARSDRQMGVGEWRFAAGDAGIWIGTTTATMTQGWSWVSGAERDADRVIVRVRGSFRPLPASAFADDAEIERFLDYVSAHAAPKRVGLSEPAADIGPYAAPRD